MGKSGFRQYASPLMTSGLCSLQLIHRHEISVTTSGNTVLAFTSVGVTEDIGVNSRGAWVFRILGQLSHYSGALVPPVGRAPFYAQLYLYDPRQALQQRMTRDRNDGLREDTMASLQLMLSETHQYTVVYKHAYEVLQAAGDVPDATITLRVCDSQDRRRYNLPIIDEVAHDSPWRRPWSE